MIDQVPFPPHVPSSDHMEAFVDLQTLMANDNNFESSRSLLQREGTSKYIEQDDRKKGKMKLISGPVLGVVPHLGSLIFYWIWFTLMLPSPIKLIMD